MKKKVLAAILTGIMLLGLVGCGAKEEAPAEVPAATEEEAAAPEETPAAEAVKVGVLMKTMSDTFSNKLGESIEAYAAEAYPDVELYLMDGQADVAKQISQAEVESDMGFTIISFN